MESDLKKSVNDGLFEKFKICLDRIPTSKINEKFKFDNLHKQTILHRCCQLNLEKFVKELLNHQKHGKKVDVNVKCVSYFDCKNIKKYKQPVSIAKILKNTNSL